MPSPPSVDGNSPCGRLALQPDPEDVASCIHVPIMRRTTVLADPESHSERIHTFRGACGNGPASRTRSGSPSFVGDHEYSSAPSGLILELSSEGRPTGILDGLCHPGLCEFGRTYVTDDDKLIFAGDLRRSLVEVMAPSISDLRVDRADSALLISSLSDAERRMVPVKEPERGNLFPTAQCREIFQTKVDSNRPITEGQVVSDFALKRDIPASARVLYEHSTPKIAFDFAGLPETEAALEICDLIATDLHGPGDEGQPPERPARSKAHTEPRTATALISRPDKLSANGVHRVRVQPKQHRTPGSELRQVKSRRPPRRKSGAISRLCAPLGLNAEVPNLVTSHRIFRELSGGSGVLETVLEGDYRHRGILTCRLTELNRAEPMRAK